MLVSGQAGPLEGPAAVGEAIATASRTIYRTPATASPTTASPPQQPTRTFNARRSWSDRVTRCRRARLHRRPRSRRLSRAASAIASQTVEAVELVDALFDHSSHRDRAGGGRITGSTSAKGKTTRDLVQKLQKTVDEPWEAFAIYLFCRAGGKVAA